MTSILDLMIMFQGTTDIRFYIKNSGSDYAKTLSPLPTGTLLGAHSEGSILYFAFYTTNVATNIYRVDQTDVHMSDSITRTMFSHGSGLHSIKEKVFYKLNMAGATNYNYARVYLKRAGNVQLNQNTAGNEAS